MSNFLSEIGAFEHILCHALTNSLFRPVSIIVRPSLELFTAIRSERESSPRSLAYLIAGAVFLLLSFITLRLLLLGDTFFIYRDLTWPTDNSDLLTNLFYSLDLESLRRTIYLGPIFALSNLIGLSSLDTEKMLFVLVRFLTGFLAFFAIYRFIGSHLGENKNNRWRPLFLVSILGAFFYAYNPVATTMVSPTLGFAFSYALVPLTFYFFDRALNHRNFQNIVITSALITLTLAGTTQYLILLPLFLLLPWFVIIFLLPSNRRARKGMIKTALFLTALVGLFSSYWILPAISARAGGISLEPQQYIISTDFLDVVSSSISLDKVIRLMGDWWPRVEIVPLFDETAWTLLTFAIPIAVISFVAYPKRSVIKFYILGFFLLSTLLIFFNKGTQPPVSSFYPMLLDIPAVGWMFRIPSKFAMILAFTATMIISFGFYSILSQNGTGVRRIIRHVLPSGFLISVCILSWPMFTGDLGGVISKHGYQPTPAAADSGPFLTATPSNQNIAVVGGLEKAELVTTNSSPDAPHSIVFLDQSLKNNAYDLTALDNVLVDDKESFLMHLLPEDAIVVSPFDATNRYSPNEVFSRGRTDYALNGTFPTNYLDKLSINSRDLDFGQGVVFSLSDDIVDVPFAVPKSGSYDILVRNVESQAGGMINVYLDGSRLGSISTLSEHNGFSWNNVGNLTLPEGPHSLTLEGLRGFNAINVVVLVPSAKVSEMEHGMNEMLVTNTNRLIYTVVPDHFTAKGENIGETILTPLPSNGSDSTSYFSEITIPEQTSYMTAQLLMRPSIDSNPSSIRINSLELFPLANEDILFLSDFESAKTTPQYIYNTEKFVLSTEITSPLSGKKSLRVEMEQGSSSDVNIISTDFVSLSTIRGVLNTRMFVTTDKVNYLESKLVYFDQNKLPISTHSIYSIGGDNPRTFYILDLNIPNNAKFAQLQFLTRMNPDTASSFVLDVITIEQRYPDRGHRFEIFGNSRSFEGGDFLQISDNSAEFDIRKNLEGTAVEEFHQLSTGPIDVTPGLRYVFSAELQANNVDSVSLNFVYFSHDIIKASEPDSPSGQILILGPDEEVTANVELLRSSNHTVAILAGGCTGADCPSLKIKIGDLAEDLVPLQVDEGDFQWLYLTKYIPAGETDLTITAIGGGAHVKGVVFVSDASSIPDSSLSILDISTDDDSNLDTGTVTISDYAQINPTTYSAKIDASQPFVLRFEKPYHSMWRAQIDDRSYAPIRVFSAHGGLSNIVEATEFPAINGYLIDSTGQLNVVVEYEPHNWYLVGLAVTILAFSSSCAYFGLQKWKQGRKEGVSVKSQWKEMFVMKRKVTKVFTKAEISVLQASPQVPTRSISSFILGGYHIAVLALVLLLAVAVSLSFSLLSDTQTTSAMTIIYILFVVAGVWQFLYYFRVPKLERERQDL